MPASRREMALKAIEELLKTIPNVKHFRMPDHVLAQNEMPYVALYDGDDAIETLNTDDTKVITGLSIDIGVRSDDAGEAESLGTKLNDLYAQVRSAIGSDYTLGNTVEKVVWAGCGNPDLKNDAGPPQASVEVFYEITRQESDFNPYAPD